MTILKQKKAFSLAIFFAAIIFSAAVPVLSQARGIVPCGGYTDTGTREAPCNVQDIFSLLARATNWLIDAAGIYAVFQIINSGFWMVVTMGNEESITKRKNSLTEAVIGFVFVMMAYILINTAINYILLAGAPCNLKVNLSQPLDYITGKNSCPK